jgi:hypothetical protein
MRHDEDDQRDEDSGDDEDTGIEVTTGFFPMAWILLLCTPRIAINGRVRQRPWGTYFFPVRPGAYDVEVWFPYMWYSKCGFNSREIDVYPAETTRVSFYMWPWMFIRASMNVTHGERSQATRNESGSSPMSKLPILLLVAIPLAIIFLIFACCLGMNILAAMAGRH